MPSGAADANSTPTVASRIPARPAAPSAHGRPARCTWAGGSLRFEEPQRLVAPGQTVAFYDVQCPDAVVGAAVAA